MDVTRMLNAGEHRQPHSLEQDVHMLPTSVRNITGYPSPTEQPQSCMLPEPYEHPPPFDGMYLDRQQPNGRHPPTSLRVNTALMQPAAADGNKTSPCPTCGKRFARRSDLARHERIHTNDRPHFCPETGCNRKFIQKSALTVHMRVHSGEKPHLCERCGKPFSDSSSLARHRRTHSGRRPYRCPYADCQKTFTRQTTLTRHQNHHTGTVEEAAAATERALATRGLSLRRRTSAGTDGSYDSTSGLSSIDTPSPRGHHFPLSPLTDIPHMAALNHQGSVNPYRDPLPSHLRPGLQQPSPRSSPTSSSPSPSLFTTQRPSLTSHPGNLPVLEPPAYHDLRSGSGSPHLSTPGGWQSPVSNSMPSPMASDYQGYHDQPPPPNVPLYLANSYLRRLSSNEPDQFDLNRARSGNPSGGPIWNGSM